jgi:hypothetical protein
MNTYAPEAIMLVQSVVVALEFYKELLFVWLSESKSTRHIVRSFFITVSDLKSSWYLRGQ